jgi:hypothetical protein
MVDLMALALFVLVPFVSAVSFDLPVFLVASLFPVPAKERKKASKK